MRRCEEVRADVFVYRDETGSGAAAAVAVTQVVREKTVRRDAMDRG